MNLIKCYQTHSTWYKGARAGSKPVGVLWHDTAASNPSLKRYVQPYETDANYNEMMALLGKNKYGNDICKYQGQCASDSLILEFFEYFVFKELQYRIEQICDSRAHYNGCEHRKDTSEKCGYGCEICDKI